ncbi:MAG: peptide chain release factor 2 [Xanthomonadales bacterium]|nr:peptide chain release factor 2 [Xanthomonadales bacterium]
MEQTALKALQDDLSRRAAALRRYLDYDGKQEKLEEVTRELEDPNVWNDAERAQSLNKERAALDKSLTAQREVIEGVSDAGELLEMAVEEDDPDTLASVEADLQALERKIGALEFQRMFSGDMDDRPCFIDIQAGSGGTEAQDWAEMLLRMYLRWAENRGWDAEIVEASAGEVAGIKSATIRVEGEYAYGWCRTETGVHRLVRKSPYDSGNRRHTSFASVFVSPEVDDNIDIEIDPSDLRIDVYRASGAGGQHVNRTESAVRITHEPSGIVVQCQTDRSQHKNKDRAMSQLRAKLYEMELQKQREQAQAAEEEKADIGWGSQIRNYVLDQSRIKDLRTGVERTDTQKVLDGDLDEFVGASLKAGLE